jgi:hypothetical protein
MQHLVLLIADDEMGDHNEKSLAEIGFRKMLATDDRKLAFQLPYPSYATMREGDSPETIRDEVMKELARKNISAFVLVAQGFVCGRT